MVSLTVHWLVRHRVVRAIKHVIVSQRQSFHCKVIRSSVEAVEKHASIMEWGVHAVTVQVVHSDAWPNISMLVSVNHATVGSSIWIHKWKACLFGRPILDISVRASGEGRKQRNERARTISLDQLLIDRRRLHSRSAKDIMP